MKKIKTPKLRTEYEVLKTVRKTWKRNPVTKIKDSKKKYQRNWKDDEILGIGS